MVKRQVYDAGFHSVVHRVIVGAMGRAMGRESDASLYGGARLGTGA